jgi:hypothetical protein
LPWTLILGPIYHLSDLASVGALRDCRQKLHAEGSNLRDRGLNILDERHVGWKFGGREYTEGDWGLINCRPSLCTLKIDLINLVYPENSMNITQLHILMVCVAKSALRRLKSQSDF